MTFPERSTLPCLAPFVGAKVIVPSPRVAYEDGPIAIQDSSKGLKYQRWRARYVSDTVYLAAPNHPETVFLIERCVTSISLAFDQNGRPLLTYLKDGNLYIYWHHTITQKYERTLINSNVTSHSACLDNKSPLGILNSNVIVGYTKDNNLYMTKQADRYGTSYLMAEGVNGYLIQVGMNRKLRLQFLVQANHSGTYSETKPWGETYG